MDRKQDDSSQSSTESSTDEPVILTRPAQLKTAAASGDAGATKPAKIGGRISNVIRQAAGTGKTGDSTTETDSGKENNFPDVTRHGVKSDAPATGEQGSVRANKPHKSERPKGNVVGKFVFLGALFLVLVILGDTLRIVDEWYSFDYDVTGFEIQTKVGHTSLVFCVSIASCLSVIGVLGLVLLFLLAAQVAYVSKVLLLHPNISLIRTMTTDEWRLVRMLLTDDE